MGVIGIYFKKLEVNDRVSPCTKVEFQVYFDDRDGKKQAIMV